ncbi:MAG: helix-turn-helix transcriptional regulator [Rhodobacteraceae bacterium]|nr:helix-turn-helix transcriptional regulator [Paracoccaceae bacterium]
MAGTKKYVRDDLLDKATALFQRHGYTATSTSHLVEELGVNRKSLYA